MKRRHLGKFFFLFGIFFSLFLICASSIVSLNNTNSISASAAAPSTGNYQTSAIDECTNHVYIKTYEVAATCTSNGAITYTCKYCGYQETHQYPATGHNYVKDETRSTTITTVYTCSTCGDTYSEYLGHSFHYVYCDKDGDTTNPIEPTCTTYGYRIKACTVEGCNETDGYVERVLELGHDYIEDLAKYKEPTCTESGTRVYICSRCGEVLEQTVSATGHDYQELASGAWGCVKCGDIMSTTFVAVVKMYTNIFFGENQYIKYLFVVMGSGIVIWGLYLGFTFAVATDDEAKKKAKRRLMNLAIGVVVIVALIAIAVPIITAMASFVG